MKRTLCLMLLALVGCSGPDSDPVEVAERFHTLRVAGQDSQVYALLTDADRAAFPPEAFPTELPTPMMLDLMGWGETQMDSAALLESTADTARVLLHMDSGERDTIRLRAIHDPQKILFFEWDRVRWRVSMQLAEQAMMDSLAAVVRASDGVMDSTTLARAEEYLQAAERYPDRARPADVDAARGLTRAGEVAEALEIELQLSESIEGTPFIDGSVENPTDRRINTITLVVQDASGAEESFELWDIQPGDSASVWRITRLQRPPITYRVQRVRVF